jgi:endonuclease/exonuclease/phosphatase family metal-dependent hydrolase
MRPTRVLTRVLAVAATALAVALPLSAPGVAQARSHPQVTVMTRNLYLGADLTPAVQAQSVEQFFAAVTTIFGTVAATDYPTRSGALANEVLADQPDLIGLQEVSTWTLFVNGAPAQTLDFLAILQLQLAGRGLQYDVAAVSHNASIGPVPLPSAACPPTTTCAVQFQDRDVILVRHGSGVATGNARDGSYATQQVLTTPIGQLSFDRGWASVDATLDGHAFRFAVTHLETEDAPAVQEAQGREFLAAVKTQGAIIAVGDFNSAADGSTTTTYADLTGDYFRDGASGVGFTCCQNGTLSNLTSQLHSRIDLVLAHGPAQPQAAHRVGATPFRTSAPPYWASDHAGVVATLRLP